MSVTPNGTIAQTAWTDATLTAGSSPPKPTHITQLRSAIDNLQSKLAGVENCGFTNFCQTCQACQVCQSCQTATCQSLAQCYQMCYECLPCNCNCACATDS